MRIKNIIVLSLVIIVVFSLCGCGNREDNNKNSKQYTTNDKFNQNKMFTLSGEEVNVSQNNYVQVSIESGFGYELSEQQQKLLNDNKYTGVVNEPYSMMDSIVTEEMITLMNDIQKKELSNEKIVEYNNKLYEMQVFYQGIFRYSKDDKQSQKQYEQFNEKFDEVEELVSLGKDTYYYGYNNNFSDYNLTDEELELLNKIIEDKENFKDNIIVFAISNAFDGNMSNFETTNLDGDNVTQEIFKDYDLTMVNIWATWCGYCVAEFPELQKLYSEQLPENVNLITVCDDGEDNKEIAKQMVSDVDASFQVLIPDKSLKDNLMKYVQAFPTTIFVDKNGNAVGKEITGVPKSDDTANEYLKLIKERLAMVSQ